MSTRIMAICWPLTGLSILQKAVLISLADQSNDQGICWPSVGTICERVCASERAVRRCIAELVDFSLISRTVREGKPTYYHVTPDRYAPLPEVHPCQKEHEPLPEVPLTPARSAHITVSEPSIEPSLKPSRKKLIKYGDGDLLIAELMHEKIALITRSTKKPNLDSWAETIRLIRVNDLRSTEEISAVFLWATQDSFWRTNILSPEKLRKQFNALVAKRNQEQGNGQVRQGNSGYQQRDNSAAGRVAANIARERAERETATARFAGEPLVANGSIVRPQMDQQLRGSSGPGECMGSVLEGDFSRAD